MTPTRTRDEEDVVIRLSRAQVFARNICIIMPIYALEWAVLLQVSGAISGEYTSKALRSLRLFLLVGSAFVGILWSFVGEVLYALFAAFWLLLIWNRIPALSGGSGLLSGYLPTLFVYMNMHSTQLLIMLELLALLPPNHHMKRRLWHLRRDYQAFWARALVVIRDASAPSTRTSVVPGSAPFAGLLRLRSVLKRVLLRVFGDAVDPVALYKIAVGASRSDLAATAAARSEKPGGIIGTKLLIDTGTLAATTLVNSNGSRGDLVGDPARLRQELADADPSGNNYPGNFLWERVKILQNPFLGNCLAKKRKPTHEESAAASEHQAEATPVKVHSSSCDSAPTFWQKTYRYLSFFASLIFCTICEVMVIFCAVSIFALDGYIAKYVDYEAPDTNRRYAFFLHGSGANSSNYIIARLYMALDPEFDGRCLLPNVLGGPFKISEIGGVDAVANEVSRQVDLHLRAIMEKSQASAELESTSKSKLKEDARPVELSFVGHSMGGMLVAELLHRAFTQAAAGSTESSSSSTGVVGNNTPVAPEGSNGGTEAIPRQSYLAELIRDGRVVVKTAVLVSSVFRGSAILEFAHDRLLPRKLFERVGLSSPIHRDFMPGSVKSCHMQRYLGPDLVQGGGAGSCCLTSSSSSATGTCLTSGSQFFNVHFIATGFDQMVRPESALNVYPHLEVRTELQQSVVKSDTRDENNADAGGAASGGSKNAEMHTAATLSFDDRPGVPFTLLECSRFGADPDGVSDRCCTRGERFEADGSSMPKENGCTKSESRTNAANSKDDMVVKSWEYFTNLGHYNLATSHMVMQSIFGHLKAGRHNAYDM